MWHNMAQRYKKLSSTLDTNCTNDDQIVAWPSPYYDSLKFLSNVNRESSNESSEPQIFRDVRKYSGVVHPESSNKPSEPKIFKDVRKYVQQRLNEGEKGSILGDISDTGPIG